MGRMRARSVIALLYCIAVAGSVAGSAQPSNTLQPPSTFSGIRDPAERSRALFAEAAKVLTHPRCMNCHPATDRPLQGNDQHPHRPPALRGDAGAGTAANACTTCHTERNFTLSER